MQADDYVDIGRYLRDVRESLGASVEQAAQVLHIQAKYLDKLEAGNLQDMPPRAYVRGYIKNYAEFLLLDSNEVLKAYEKLFEGDGQKFFVPENNTQQGLPSNNILWSCVAGLVVLYGYWCFAEDHSAAKNLLIESPPPVESTTGNTALAEPWRTCLGTGNLNCFTELQLKNETAVVRLPGTVDKIDIKIVKPEEPKTEEPKPETAKPEPVKPAATKPAPVKRKAVPSDDDKEDNDDSDSDDKEGND